MSENALQISKRLPDGTIVVVGGQNPTEFANNLTGVIGEEGRDAVRALFYNLIDDGGITKATATVETAFPEAAPAAPTPAPVSPPPRRSAPAAPPGNPPVCDHGYAREYKTGTGARGPWAAWFCSLKREEGACAPQWLNSR